MYSIPRIRCFKVDKLEQIRINLILDASSYGFYCTRTVQNL